MKRMTMGGKKVITRGRRSKIKKKGRKNDFVDKSGV
jgi:hypothetical protein